MPYAQTGSEADPLESLEQLSALTLSDWLWAGGILTATIVLAVVVRRIVSRTVGKAAEPLVARLLGRVAGAIVFIIGFVYALQQVGVSIAPLLGLVGLLGLAFAFAFQDILSNFLAGVFMSLRRPFSQGDEIEAGGYEGKVEDIQLRALTLATFDGERVYIPNAEVWQNAIVNHTERGVRRTTLAVGVSYDADLEDAKQIILDAVSSVEGVESEPAPQCLWHEFGDSSVNAAVRFWHEPTRATMWKVRDGVAIAVKKALDEAGIEIPFPQRVVTYTNAN